MTHTEDGAGIDINTDSFRGPERQTTFFVANVLKTLLCTTLGTFHCPSAIGRRNSRKGELTIREFMR